METWMQLLAGSVGIGEEDSHPPGTLCVASELVNAGEFLGGAGCGGEKRELEACGVNDWVHIEVSYQIALISSTEHQA